MVDIGQEWERGVEVSCKVLTQGNFEGRTFLCLDLWWQFLESIHVLKLHRINKYIDRLHTHVNEYVSACNTCEIWLSSLDCVIIIFLVVKPCLTIVFQDVSIEGKRVQGKWEFPIKLSSLWIYNYFKIKRSYAGLNFKVLPCVVNKGLFISAETKE